MKNSTIRHGVIAVLIFLCLILGYILTVRMTDDDFREPHYDRYDQSNRLEKIRKGLKGR